MARPPCCRFVGAPPACTYFKPRGVPLCQLEEVVLGLDEVEALRLADREGLYQEEAAARMGVSRATFGRIVESARRKVADALVGGKGLCLQGGVVMRGDRRTFRCSDCRHVWDLPFGTGRPAACPACGSRSLRRAEADRGRGGRDGGGPHCCRRGQAEGRVAADPLPKGITRIEEEP